MFITLIESLVWSGVLVTLIILCGLGVANITGLRNMAGRVLLAPGLFVAVTALVIGTVVHMRIPIQQASPFIWGGWAVLAVYGLRGARAAIEHGELRRTLALAFLVSVLVLGGFEWFGLFDYLGSPNQDGWTCVAFGEYLRLYPRGTTGGLAPLYQYGSHLANSRFIESAMLALFIPPWSSHVDTQMMVGPLLLIMVFAFACSMAYVAQVVSSRGVNNSHNLSMLLGVFGGWFPFVLLANNYGNLSILSFSPILFGAALDRRIIGFSCYLIPALFSAAAIYIYPEMCILVMAAFFIAGAGGLFSAELRKKIQLWFGVTIIILILVNFYLSDALGIFFQQLAITEPLVGGRPGNGFAPDLLIMSRLPAALWGFEQITIFGMSTATVGMILGSLLALITLLGLVKAIRAKFYTLALFFAVIVILVTVMIVSKRYDYGAYKMLLLGWWATSLLLSVGMQYVWSACREFKTSIGIILRVLIGGVLFSSIVLWGNQQLTWMDGFAYKQAQPLREVRDYVKGLHEIVGASISDPILNGWMVFELRGLPVRYSEYNGYMGQTHVLPFMARSAVPRQSGNYLLVGKATLAVGKMIWSNALFSILKSGEGSPIATVDKIAAPNGVERVDGSTFFWLGRNPATVSIRSNADQTIFLHTDVTGGSSVGDWSNPVAIEIYVDGVRSDKLRLSNNSTHSIRLNLHAGSNEVVFKPIYLGSIVPNPNGDSRILIAGIKLRKLEFFK